jgi:hypothetical protein
MYVTQEYHFICTLRKVHLFFTLHKAQFICTSQRALFICTSQGAHFICKSQRALFIYSSQHNLSIRRRDPFYLSFTFLCSRSTVIYSNQFLSMQIAYIVPHIFIFPLPLPYSISILTFRMHFIISIHPPHSQTSNSSDSSPPRLSSLFSFILFFFMAIFFTFLRLEFISIITNHFIILF